MTSLALIGPGRHGTAIAQLFASHGVDITLFHHRPEKAATAADAVRASAVDADVVVAPTLAAAVEGQELVVLSTVWGTAQRVVIGELGDALGGKILLDVSNPLDMTPDGAELRRPDEGSAGQFVAGLLPQGVGQVKAFANLSTKDVRAAALGSPAGPLPYAADSVTTAARFIPYLERTGWPTRLVGDISVARDLEIGGIHSTGTGRWGPAVVGAGR